MNTAYRFHLVAALGALALIAYAFVFPWNLTVQNLSFTACLVVACGWSAHAGAFLARPRASSELDLTRLGQSLISIANSLENQNTALTFVANNIDEAQTRGAQAALEIEQQRVRLVGIRYTLRLDETKRLGLDEMIASAEKAIALLLPAETADGELADDLDHKPFDVDEERRPLTH